MYSQHQNSLNKPQLVLAIQQMVEVHAELMQVLTQNLIDSGSKELPPGMQQVLDDHSRMVQMMPQILASTNNNLPQNNHGSKEPRDESKLTMLARKICGEIGHLSEECQEQCHHCNTSHPTRECPMTKVTCFLCDGTNHVPRECKFYFTVQQMNQQAKDRLSHLLVRTPEDRRPKAKLEAEDKKEAPDSTTKSCLTSRKQEHLPGNSTKKRERFPTAVVECQENEVRELLALE
jgi:hypothetical protein